MAPSAETGPCSTPSLARTRFLLGHPAERLWGQRRGSVAIERPVRQIIHSSSTVVSLPSSRPARRWNPKGQTMDYTRLGTTDITIPRLCIGGMSFGKVFPDFHQ